nr:hypothetical protein Iba_scaffold6362CG0010 [Ipomoea batatas]GME07575.1 hypothetical protein Iba_scaffold6363CG0020 [Ipomoea batatas]GME21131.1 hypothetical protein Iba_scaffold26887CG0010 [Ipomoea batatas]
MAIFVYFGNREILKPRIAIILLVVPLPSTASSSQGMERRPTQQEWELPVETATESQPVDVPCFRRPLLLTLVRSSTSGQGLSSRRRQNAGGTYNSRGHPSLLPTGVWAAKSFSEQARVLSSVTFAEANQGRVVIAVRRSRQCAPFRRFLSRQT